MDVRLLPTDGDRIVVEYFSRQSLTCDVCGTGEEALPHHSELEAHTFRPRGTRVVIALEGVSETYSVLWKRHDEEAWRMMWRGAFDSCLKYFGELVGDMVIEDEVSVKLPEGSIA